VTFPRSPLGTSLIGLAVVAALIGTIVTIQVWRVTQPPRHVASRPDMAALMIRFEDVTFRSTDGIRLDGWLFPGPAGAPAVILCHDFGSDRGSLTTLSQRLQQIGFTTLAFDFRSHGASAGRGSSLGVKEKRDVIGAIDFLIQRDPELRGRMGVFGVGMGAHAAVLAATDRNDLKVLVLDDLYPDATWPLVRATYGGWNFGVRHLRALPEGIFTVLHGARPSRHRAADLLRGLTGRDLLLLAPAGNSGLAIEMQLMYESVPVETDADPNLVVMPVTAGEGLFGEHVQRYNDRVVQFFVDRLAAQ
jgi:pimeloyl-ACP methyl ester carboxylesterase